jgi:chromosome partitioning protein
MIPLQCEYFALEGIAQLLQTINRVKKKLNPSLSIEGVLLTMFDSRTNLSNQVMEDAAGHFRDKVYKTIIPRNVKLAEAPSFGKPITKYESGSIGAKSYRKLSMEIINNA